ncbi:hypothetical protein E308F_29700 [Moorella sp. E308F]|uniref:hypothetical protein n=1 Tax=Moorella sp. E308F TaxID=2572682 RepID=UPI0010FFB326|nr:hypothetical protein [Moorella sp. E308F]GEA16724.1 hypothetical protein E308F_29700 [Moorella sp. E308F]
MKRVIVILAIVVMAIVFNLATKLPSPPPPPPKDMLTEIMDFMEERLSSDFVLEREDNFIKIIKFKEE